MDAEARRRLTNQLVAVVTIAIGLLMVAIGTGLIPTDPSRPHEGRWIMALMGLAFAAGGVQVAQWFRADSVVGAILGALTITALAVAFGWASLFGEASGYSSAVAGAGIAVKSGAGVTIGRVAFGFAAVVVGLLAAWAWWRVIRHVL